MDPNPYEPPRSIDQNATPRNWFRIVLADAVFALFGAAAAFFVTAPAGAIDGGGEYYPAMGAVAGVITHRLLRWQHFLASREQSIEKIEKQRDPRKQQDQQNS